MFAVFGVELVCSDEACAEVVEAVGHLDGLDMLLCECGCTLHIVAVWEAHEERIEPPAPAAFGLAA